MPIYELIDQSGAVTEAILRSRDDVPKGFRRAFPSRISVTGLKPEKTTIAEDVKRGYYEKECREGSRFRSMHTKKFIKKAWKL